jgi:hypothetical protein
MCNLMFTDVNEFVKPGWVLANAGDGTELKSFS